MFFVVRLPTIDGFLHMLWNIRKKAILYCKTRYRLLMMVEFYHTFRIFDPIAHCGFLCWPFSVNSYVSLLTKNQIFCPDLKIARAPCFWAVLAIVWGKEPEMLQNDFWRFQKPNIRSRSKNSSRAMFLSRSDNSFGPGTRNASNGFLEVAKTRYLVQTQK